jgi:hypothetical protein
MKSTECTLENTQLPCNLDEAFTTEYEGRTDIRTYAEFQGDKLVTKTIQNQEPILQNNAERRKYDDELWNASSDLKFVATIPLATLMAWDELGITQDSKAFLKAIELHPEFKVTNRRLA